MMKTTIGDGSAVPQMDEQGRLKPSPELEQWLKTKGLEIVPAGNAEIARMAIDMQQKRRIVEKWMFSVETLVTADMCPQWKDYAEAQLAFQKALFALAEAQPVRA